MFALLCFIFMYLYIVDWSSRIVLCNICLDSEDTVEITVETSMAIDPNGQGTLRLQARHVRGRKPQYLKKMEISIFRYTSDNSRFFEAIIIVKTLRL